MKTGHEMISTAFLSLLLIQEGSCQLLAKEYVLNIGNCLGDFPRHSVDRLSDCAQNDLKSVEGP